MIDHVLRFTLPATRALLPAPMMASPRAWAMLLAIGLQESKFLERQQVLENGLPNGPARGFWQFERGGGVKGVMTHPRSREVASQVLLELRYRHLLGKFRETHYALRDNDVLACAFARLLLWTLPNTLPARDNAAAGWHQYLEAWRPGRPHPSTWAANYREAWERVSALPEWREP